MNLRTDSRALRDAVVVITGASSGVGACLAEVMAREGARLVLAARTRETLEDVAGRCRDRGADVLVVPGDVTDRADCDALIDRTVECFGAIDVLVACAGLGMWARFGDLSDERVLRSMMAVNYWGVVLPARRALPHLRRSKGMLVAVSSVQARIGVPSHSGYAAAKHAVQGFCDSLRIEEREHGVEVLTVLAHWIRGTGLRARALGSDGEPRGDHAPTHGGDAMPATVAAERIVHAIRRRRRQIYLPARMRLLSLAAELLPSWTDRVIARRVQAESKQRH